MTDYTNFIVVPTENVDLRQLIKTENFVFDKIMTAFGVLLKEMDELTGVAERDFFGQLSMFGESLGAELEEGEAAQQVVRMLPLLRNLSFFLNRA